ncbi:YczE/YyaS/YitT family protein [Sutcliffiella deserti]|uniref:YczE/YyaS/YitT family protein n=1 Tax=Sutcliffiella deserti TaxID=2875501 RepID=UPI001CC0AAE0|nr:membrane protein [Sutcliffiella deserti]
MKIRILFYLLGLFILSLGVSLTIKSNLGAGAWDALNVGLSQTIGLTVGSWVFIVGIILIAFNAVLGKRKPDYLAVITIFLVGTFIDFWLIFVMNAWVPVDLGIRFVTLLIGIMTLSLGISTYLPSKLPLVPIDNLMVAIQERFKVSLMTAKTIGEITALIFAFIFKGPIGIGTLIITFGIGPLIQVFYPKVEKFYKRLRHES